MKKKLISLIVAFTMLSSLILPITVFALEPTAESTFPDVKISFKSNNDGTTVPTVIVNMPKDLSAHVYNTPGDNSYVYWIMVPDACLDAMDAESLDDFIGSGTNTNSTYISTNGIPEGWKRLVLDYKVDYGFEFMAGKFQVTTEYMEVDTVIPVQITQESSESLHYDEMGESSYSFYIYSASQPQLGLRQKGKVGSDGNTLKTKVDVAFTGANDITYGENFTEPTIEVKTVGEPSTTLVENTDYTVSVEKDGGNFTGTPKDAGEYKYTVTLKDEDQYSFNSTASNTYKISPAEISVDSWGTLKANNKPFDGNTDVTLSETPTITYNGIVTGEEAEDVIGATYAWSAATAETADVVATVALKSGNYTLQAESKTHKYESVGEITKKSIDVSQLTYPSYEKTYDETTNINSVGDITFGEDQLVDGYETLTVSATGASYNTDANASDSKTVTVTGLNIEGDDSGNYKLSADTYANVSGKISKATPTITGLPSSALTGYEAGTMKDFAPDVASVKVIGVSGADLTSDYNITYSATNGTVSGTEYTPASSGTASITASAAQKSEASISTQTNYANSTNETFNITVGEEKPTLTAEIKNNTVDYDGTNQEVTVEFKGDLDVSLIKDTDYTVKYKANTDEDESYNTTAPVNAGTYDVKVELTAEGLKNYKMSAVTGSLTINKGNNTDTLTVNVNQPTSVKGNGSLEFIGTDNAVVEIFINDTCTSPAPISTVTLTSGKATAELAAGTYYARYKETNNTKSGKVTPENGSVIKNCYSITYEKGLYSGADGLSSSAKTTFLEGDEIDLSKVKYETLDDGVTQKGWRSDIGTIENNKISPTDNVKFTAVWEQTVPVSVKAEGASAEVSATPTSITFAENTTNDKLVPSEIITLNAADTANYTYAWKADDGVLGGTLEDNKYTVNEMSAVTPNAKLEFTATYSIIKSTITATSSTNGTYTYSVDGNASVNGGTNTDNVEAGKTVTITTTPQDNTYHASVKVNDDKVNVTKNDDGTFTFTMPAEAATITVTFSQEPTVEATVTNPANIDGKLNGTAKFEVTATVTDPQTGSNVTYEWYKKSGTGDIKVGENSNVLNLTNLKLEDAGSYYCKVTIKAVGYLDYVTTTTDAILTVTEIKNKITSNTPENGTYTYTVNGGESINGGAESDEILAGSTVAVTPVANTGYTIGDVTVTKADDATTKVSVTKNNGVYTFEMPEYAASINVTFKKKSSGGGGGGGTSSYTVKYDAGANGKITDGKTSESVTSGSMPKAVPTITANDGYEFIGWSQDGKTVVVPTETKITKSVTFTALYKEKVEPTATPQVETENHKHYINGYEDGTFRAENQITRAEVATIIALAMDGYDADKEYVNTYSDMDGSEWYVNYVSYLSEIGAITGYEDGTFRPQNNITRQEFATMIAKLGTVLEAQEMPFSDVSNANWGIDYIYTTYANNWVAGYEDGTFRPENEITRAESVRIVNGYLGRNIDASSLENAEYDMFDDVSTTHWAYYEIIEAANDHGFETNTNPEKWID